MSSVSTTTREKPHTIIVHPLVLLSATDHFYRVARDTQNRRVVGLLLGESFKGRIVVINPEKSEIAQKLNIPSKGNFAIKTR